MKIVFLILIVLSVLALLTSKMFDTAKFRGVVESCIVSGNSNIVGQICDFNCVLPDKYMITEEEFDAFISIYKQYEQWLTAKCLDKNFKFSGRYEKRFFLEETMYDFLNDHRSNRFGGRLIFQKDEEIVVAYKLAYASEIIRSKNGKSAERYVEYAEKDLKAAVENEV